MDFVFVRHGESDNNLLREVIVGQHGASAQSDKMFAQQRSHDPALTTLGKAQVEAVAQRVKREYPDMHEVWVSFLSRALGTAAAVHAALPHTRVLVMRDINECGGSYRYCHEAQGFIAEPGVSRKDVAAKHPTFEFHDASQPPSDEAGWYTGSGKESAHDSHQRAVALIERVEAAAASQCSPRQDSSSQAASSSPPPLVGVITHGDFFRVLLTELLDSNRLALVGDVVDRIRLGKNYKGPASDAWVKNTSVTHFRIRPRLSPNPNHGCQGEAEKDNRATPSRGAPSLSTHHMAWEVQVLADAEHLKPLEASIAHI